MMRRASCFLALALVATGAQAQSITTFVGTSPTGYALDGQPAPTIAVGLRRLRTSYSTNKLIRLRRSSDDAELDIGFTATGAIDTATAVTHCAATSCFVKTWYDQSGNGFDLSQGTANSQPDFVFSCLGTSPCVQMTTAGKSVAGSSITPATGVFSLSAVGNRVSGTGMCVFIRENGAAQNNMRNTTNPNSWFLAPGAGITYSSANDNQWHAGVGVGNTTSSVLNVDNVETIGTVTGTVTAGTPGMVGANSTVCNSLGAIIWDNVALTATQRTMIVNNQRAWWGF